MHLSHLPPNCADSSRVSFQQLSWGLQGVIVPIGMQPFSPYQVAPPLSPFPEGVTSQTTCSAIFVATAIRSGLFGGVANKVRGWRGNLWNKGCLRQAAGGGTFACGAATPPPRHLFEQQFPTPLGCSPFFCHRFGWAFHL